MIGSDASNILEDQALFDSFEFDCDQSILPNADLSQLVAGAEGAASFESDETLLDTFHLGSLSPQIRTSDHDADVLLHMSPGDDQLEDIRTLSPLHLYRRTFGNHESPITSGSLFPSLESTQPSSLGTSMPTSGHSSLQFKRTGMQRPGEQSPLWSTPPTGGALNRTRSTSLASAQRRRSRAGSNGSTNPNGTRKAVRKGPLEAGAKKKAGKMRSVGACKFCRDHKRSCALETPCVACIQTYGSDILHHPCRDSLAECITHVSMHDDAKWYPSGRSLSDFHLTPSMTNKTHRIPIVLAFGPPMSVNVRVFQAQSEASVRHRHVVQTPEHRAQKNVSFLCDDLVLPIVLCNTDTLAHDIDEHITRLVESHFREFSWYRDHFNTLEKIYGLYTHYRHSFDQQKYAILLQKALRLLCLIHANDISVDITDPATQEIFMNNIWTPFQPDNRKNAGLTACYVRAEFGTVIPGLARLLMTEVLQSLFQIYNENVSDQLPVVVSVNVLLMMILESIMYKGARVPYHFFLPKTSSSTQATEQSFASDTSSDTGSASSTTSLGSIPYAPNLTSIHNGEACASVLNKRYRKYFAAQHDAFFSLDAHHPRQEQDLANTLGPVPTRFVTEMGDLVRESMDYLENKKRTAPSSSQPGEEVRDISEVFDRLTARFFLDKTEHIAS
ncbi:hypothetical protein FH972_021386 [Carpinus fangiana]|uniref:Uncharacterized protein n=1 Tax=Carpinus fangiana TaxID=176857 RepID=A0A5N6KP71_9ROSI|nr:hypothetical protein FH972_021386 [Carpinus fangiana]